MGSRRHPETGLTVRGCSNGNERGNNKARRKRKEWLLETYAADERMFRIEWNTGSVSVEDIPKDVVESMGAIGLLRSFQPVPTARCYRCGDLLWYETLTVDCIFPRAFGGIYGTVLRDKREKRTNLRPACGACNSFTGGPLATSKVHRAKKRTTTKETP